MKCLRVTGLAMLLAACATSAPPPAETEAAKSAATAPAPPGARQEHLKSQPLKYLAGRSLKAMPEKPLNIRTRCNFRDVAGGQGRMDLQVSQAEVQRFYAEISIPGQGLCRFDMKTFAQTGTLPTVVLTDPQDGCVVRMWEQGKGVTVAFNRCQAKCSGDAFSYLWPILVDTRSGRCA